MESRVHNNWAKIYFDNRPTIALTYRLRMILLESERMHQRPDAPTKLSSRAASFTDYGMMWQMIDGQRWILKVVDETQLLVLCHGISALVT